MVRQERKAPAKARVGLIAKKTATEHTKTAMAKADPVARILWKSQLETRAGREQQSPFPLRRWSLSWRTRMERLW